MNRSTIAVRRWASVHALVWVLCLSVQWTGPVAFAATFDGHSGVNGNWSTPTNWVGNVVPTSGSPNLEVRLTSTGTSSFTSVQNLGSPFELQQLSIDPAGAFTHHTINGAPLAFSNLGAAPIVRGVGDPVFAPDLTINADMALNAALLVQTTQGFGGWETISLNGAISGVDGIEMRGGGDVRLGGATPNTYDGVTTATSGVLYLQKSPSVTAIPGNLYINRVQSTFTRSGEVHILNDNQIAAEAQVTFNSGTLYVTGGDQTLAYLEFIGLNRPSLNADGGNVVISPSRTLTVTGGLTRTSVSDSVFTPSTSLISGGTLNLSGGPRPFHVDNVNAPGFQVTTLTVSSVIANGGIQKTGAGVLELSGVNTFVGDVNVTGGRLNLDPSGELRFDLENDGASNRILGTADAFLNGAFRIDPAGVTDVSSSWNLVDVVNLNETFGSEFKLQFVGGTSFTIVGAGVYRSGRWKFTTADGNLTLSAVPEPATVALAACGGLALVSCRRGGCRLTAFAIGA